MEPALKALADLVRKQAGDAPMPLSKGGEWWELTPEEAAVFDIDPAAFPLMMQTFNCFEALTGQADGTDYDTRHEALLEAVRAARPDLAQPDLTGEAFAAFALASGLLTAKQAFTMVWKVQAWHLRFGLLTFSDGS